MATAKDLMSCAVRGVSDCAQMREAIALFSHHDLSGLPVTDSEGHLKGVVSEYDALAAFTDPSVLDDPVTKHMTSEMFTIEASDTVEHIAELFREKRVYRAPVIDGPKVIGIVSRTDLVRYLSQFV